MPAIEHAEELIPVTRAELTALTVNALRLSATSIHDHRAAERAQSGLAVGDNVLVLVGGHSGEEGKITGVTFLGAWEVTVAAMPYAYSSRHLRKLTAAELSALTAA